MLCKVQLGTFPGQSVIVISKNVNVNAPLPLLSWPP
jgi:hypothetical protein